MRIINDNIQRQLQVFDDETNLMTSPVTGVWPPTTLDAVFDQDHPNHRTLRQIIADLRQEIIMGGVGSIVFPVTSVNGQSSATGQSDVRITAASVGLGFVNNTRDMDKPLSTPQRNAVRDMLADFDWEAGNVNMEKFYEHIMDRDNPHMVTIDQLGSPEYFENLIDAHITIHSQSTSAITHPDIRRSITNLDSRLQATTNLLENRIGRVLDDLVAHLNDDNAHFSLFEKKEDVENKVTYFNATIDNNHVRYPTTRAVVDNLTNRLLEFKDEFKEYLLEDAEWIADVRVVNLIANLPPANAANHRRVFLVRNCAVGQMINRMGIAVCRYNVADSEYYWDIVPTGAISRLHHDHFIETEHGFALNLTAIIDAVAVGGDPSSVGSILNNFFTKEESLATFLQNVTLLPGTMDGYIRWYFNDDQMTMQNEFKIPGLNNLAFKAFVTENEIADDAVHDNHILNQAVRERHIFPLSIQARHPHNPHIACEYGRIIGNILNEDSEIAHEVSLIQLADYMRPLIGGWPDPGVPGGNPWEDWVRDMILSPHHYTPGVEYDLRDDSFAMRFTGYVNVLPNQNLDLVISDIITTEENRLLDAGGNWQISTNVNGGEFSILGGSNLTGHTFGTIIMDQTSLRFVSMSIGERVNAPYDIWVRYTKHPFVYIPPDPPTEPPDLILSTDRIEITDTSLTAFVDLGGTAGGPIHFDRMNLPNEVEIFTHANRLTFIANRPFQQQPDQVGIFMIVITRAGINRVLAVDVNLTAMDVPLSFHVVPQIAIINDHQTTATFITSGMATEPITVDRTGIPPEISVEVMSPIFGSDVPYEFMNSNGAIILTANRPVMTPEHPGIHGIFPLRISRAGMTRVVVVQVNLTPIPLITLLSQSTMQIDNSNLNSSITVGGTTTGTITSNVDYTLPSNITLSINQTNNIISVVATRPPIGGTPIQQEFVVTVTRGGSSATFRMNVDLTPWPDPGTIMSLNAVPDIVTEWNDGNYAITLTGENLEPSLMRVGAFLNDTGDDLFTKIPVGNSTQVTTEIELPMNITENNMVYTIRGSVTAGTNWADNPHATITILPTPPEVFLSM